MRRSLAFRSRVDFGMGCGRLRPDRGASDGSAVWYMVLAAAAVLRVGGIAFGAWQDATLPVKYTDIDYAVFTDGARAVHASNGTRCPYDRATFRYTPVLALVLVPNITLHPAFGKVLFCLCDLIVGVLIRRLVVATARPVPGGSARDATLAAAAWLFNPFAFNISTRGSSESVMAALVVGTLWALASRRLVTGAVLYALAVHIKIYPAVFAIPIYVALGPTGALAGTLAETNMARRDGAGGGGGWWRAAVDFLTPTRERVVFIAAGVTSLAVVTGAMYAWCGDEFLEHTYFYHLVRRDHRHNFSLYHYHLYLTFEAGARSRLLGLAAFLPQAVLLSAIGLAFAADLPFAVFVQTAVLVVFNKVVTAQYFVWYYSLLPLLGGRLDLSGAASVALALLWQGTQLAWLAAAYYLEFEGRNTFRFVWGAAMLFFIVNVGILVVILRAYRGIGPPRRTRGGRSRSLSGGAKTGANASAAGARLKDKKVR